MHVLILSLPSPVHRKLLWKMSGAPFCRRVLSSICCGVVWWYLSVSWWGNWQQQCVGAELRCLSCGALWESSEIQPSQQRKALDFLLGCEKSISTYDLPSGIINFWHERENYGEGNFKRKNYFSFVSFPEILNRIWTKSYVWQELLELFDSIV